MLSARDDSTKKVTVCKIAMSYYSCKCIPLRIIALSIMTCYFVPDLEIGYKTVKSWCTKAELIIFVGISTRLNKVFKARRAKMAENGQEASPPSSLTAPSGSDLCSLSGLDTSGLAASLLSSPGGPAGLASSMLVGARAACSWVLFNRPIHNVFTARNLFVVMISKPAPPRVHCWRFFLTIFFEPNDDVSALLTSHPPPSHPPQLPLPPSPHYHHLLFQQKRYISKRDPSLKQIHLIWWTICWTLCEYAFYIIYSVSLRTAHSVGWKCYNKVLRRKLRSSSCHICCYWFQ